MTKSFSTTATNFAKTEMNAIAQESNVLRVEGNNYNGSFGKVRSSSLMGRHMGVQTAPMGVRSFSTGKAAEVAAPTEKVQMGINGFGRIGRFVFRLLSLETRIRQKLWPSMILSWILTTLSISLSMTQSTEDSQELLRKLTVELKSTDIS